MDQAKEDLLEAKRQIASLLHKLHEVSKTLEGKENADRLGSQITLVARRIKAFELAMYLIDNELEKKG